MSIDTSISRSGRHTAPVSSERGVAAVEMALLAPILVLLLLGTVEAAWLLGQQLDVRQAAREGGRLAAIDFGDSSTIADEVCKAMDDSTDTTVTFNGSGVALGEDIEVTVTKSPSHLTNYLSWAFPPSFTLSNVATFALEVSPPTWTEVTVSC
jgi:Flp pilus assembly protein TadG